MVPFPWWWLDEAAAAKGSAGGGGAGVSQSRRALFATPFFSPFIDECRRRSRFSDQVSHSLNELVRQNYLDPLNNRIQEKITIGTRAPGINDDFSQGYVVGSKWYYAGILWVCIDITIGVAVWYGVPVGPNPPPTLPPASLSGSGTAGKVAQWTGSSSLGDISNQSPNLVYASPSSGSGAPTFRALVAGDVPGGSGASATSGHSTGTANAVAADVFDVTSMTNGMDGSWSLKNTDGADNIDWTIYYYDVWGSSGYNTGTITPGNFIAGRPSNVNGATGLSLGTAYPPINRTRLSVVRSGASDATYEFYYEFVGS